MRLKPYNKAMSKSEVKMSTNVSTEHMIFLFSLILVQRCIFILFLPLVVKKHECQYLLKYPLMR